jgi:hypothetical protein
MRYWLATTGDKMAEWERFKRELTKQMCVGQKYSISELENLLLDSNFEFTETDNEPNSEKKPKWRRSIKNAVRESPDRTKHKGNRWPELRGELNSNGEWVYWREACSHCGL